MAINLRHLRVFAAVVDEGGFTRAAASLRLTQPAISKSINELERQLHLRLLDRDGRTLALTAAGRALHARARELFGVEKLAEQELRELRGLKRGALRIAATPTLANYMLADALGRFRRRHPRVPVRVVTGRESEIARALLESRVDLAFVEHRASDPRLEARVLHSEDVVVVAEPHHALAGGQTVDVAALADDTFLVGGPRSSSRVLAARALAAYGIRLRNALQVGGTEAIKRAAAAGLGLAVLPRAVAADYLVLGRIAELAVRGMEVRHEMLELRVHHRVPSGAARELLELLAADAADGGGEETASDASGIA